MQKIAYVNGSFVPGEQAMVPVTDRGFLFGDGIYEVTSVIDGRMVDNELHLARLQRSLGEIRIAMPAPLERIREIQHELIRVNDLSEGMVYIQVTRGAAERDFVFPAADVAPSLVMFTQQKNLVGAPSGVKGLKVMTFPDLRWTRRDIKSVNLLAQVIAKQAAAEAGCNEAWMLDGEMVTEGGSSTAYILTANDTIVTRPRSTMTLSGCTCAALQTLIVERGLKLEERPFSLAEAKAAKEAFATSATTLVAAVVEIDGEAIGDGKPGPVATELRRLYVERARAS
ncbi:MAG TPA: D-amino-acid transaminase [Rhizobiaceae bacterium]